MPSFEIALRRDYAANWVSVNPLIGDGEIIVVLPDGDTGPHMFKIGKLKADQTLTNYNDLPFFENGPPGPKGDKGNIGDQGIQGLSPDFEWEDTKLRFKQPDGTWGSWVELKGLQGDIGPQRALTDVIDLEDSGIGASAMAVALLNKALEAAVTVLEEKDAALEELINTATATVVSTPAIDMPALLSAGGEIPIGLSAESLLGSSIARFDVSVEGGALQQLDAVDNKASFNMLVTVDVGLQMAILVVAHDVLGNRSKPAKAFGTVVGESVNAPKITGITAGQIGVGLKPTITVAAFEATPSYADTAKEADNFTYKYSTTEGVTVIEKIITLPAAGGSFTIDTNLPIFTDMLLECQWFGKKLTGNKRTVFFKTTEARIEVPSILSPLQGAVDVALKPLFTFSPFESVGITDVPSTATLQLSTDATFATDVISKDFPHAESYQMTDSLGIKTVYYARVRFSGVQLGTSAFSTVVSFTTAERYVVKPVMLTPVADAMAGPSVLLTTGAFTIFNGSDVHVSTDWKITSDAEGLVAVAQEDASSDLTQHTFANFPATAGQELYAWATHNSQNNGSAKSEGRKFFFAAAIITPGKRTVYRHSSNVGSVIEFFDTAPRKVLVLDAVYRKSGILWGAVGVAMPALPGYGTGNTRGDWYLNTSNAPNNDASTAMTDEQINSLFFHSIDAKTGRQNCDIWMTLAGVGKGVPAVSYARSINAFEGGCDVPNVQTLMRMFLEAEAIDALDPTVATNTPLALGRANPSGFWNFGGIGNAWSSTNLGDSDIRHVSRGGSCWRVLKAGDYCALPVFELPAATSMTTPGGRSLYRHSSGKGTVMEFNDGVKRKVVVMDAAYRGKSAFGLYGTDVSLTNYATANTRGNWYLSNAGGANSKAIEVMTDAQINALWKDSIDAKTAKENCGVWLANGDVPAVTFARQVLLDGAGCDVPNIQTLMRIFLEANHLDALDPTVLVHPTKALGICNSGGFWGCMGTAVAWSSTEFGAYFVRYVGNDGYCYYAYKSYECFVVPCRELNP